MTSAASVAKEYLVLDAPGVERARHPVATPIKVNIKMQTGNHFQLELDAKDTIEGTSNWMMAGRSLTMASLPTAIPSMSSRVYAEQEWARSRLTLKT
jgi:hypothetical protein